MLTRSGTHFRMAKAVYRNQLRKAKALDQTEPTDYFRASATHKCKRRMYYARTGHPVSVPFEPCSREKMRKGDILHDWIRGELIPDNSDWYVEGWNPEYEVRGSYPVTLSDGNVYIVHLIGHMDGILRKRGLIRPQGELEVKTTGDTPYKQTTAKAFGDPEHYSYSYPKQANRYLHLWNGMPGQLSADMLRAIIIFVYNVNGTKDKITNLPWRDYWFKPSTPKFNEDLLFLATIERSIQRGEVPEKYFQKVCWECRKMCPYFKSCWPKDFKKESKKPKYSRRSRTRTAGSLALPGFVPTAGRPSGQ